MTAHALLGASKAHRWMACPGSVALEVDLPDTSSPHAEEGTRAHEFAALCLTGDPAPSGISVEQDMIDNVKVYVDYVSREAVGHQLLIEQRVDYSDVIGVLNSFGTSDAVILAGDTIKIIDLKYGMGVRVDATENEQLMLYALGALETFGMIGEFTKAKLVIVQPRLDHISEWTVSVEDLALFGERAARRAAEAIKLIDRTIDPDRDLRPGEKQCRFCKAKATCPALLTFVQDSVGADFDDLDADDIKGEVEEMGPNRIGIALAAVPLIEDWCKAVRAKAESELLAGREVSGYKLVQGRNGRRQWANEDEAEATLKRMKLKVEQMYDLKLVSPTTAEKLHKSGEIGPRQWPQLQSLIVQKPGPPSVAPISDKRPEYTPADDFQNLDEGVK
jgi:hypothetical protein